MAWKEYCGEYWLKELQESMDRRTGHRNITEILLKMALNNIQYVNKINEFWWLLLLLNCVLGRFQQYFTYTQQQLMLFCLSWVTPVLGWSSEVYFPRTLPQKTQSILCGSSPGPPSQAIYYWATQDPCDKFWTVLNLKRFQITISDRVIMGESLSNR